MYFLSDFIIFPTYSNAAQLFVYSFRRSVDRSIGWLYIFFIASARAPQSIHAINLSKSCSEIYGRQSHSITMSIFFLLFAIIFLFSSSFFRSPLISSALMIDCFSRSLVCFFLLLIIHSMAGFCFHFLSIENNRSMVHRKN